MMQVIPLPSDRVTIDGAVALEVCGRGVQPWRLPPEDMPLHHPSLAGPAACAAGVRLRLRTDAHAVTFGLAIPEQPIGRPDIPSGVADLVIDGLLSRTQAVSADAKLHFTGLSRRMKELELWLPVMPPYRLVIVGVNAGATFLPPIADERPRWVVYGSSITHGTGLSPARAWPMATARLLSRNLCCLGFDGGCHLDPLVAETIAVLPADFVTLEVGINIFLSRSFSPRTFGPALHGFLRTIRGKKPGVPMRVISPFLSPLCGDGAPRTRVPRAQEDLSLQDIRDAIAEAVMLRRSRGDDALDYVDGRELLDDPRLLPDGLHPGASGHQMIAERYAALRAPADSP
jgi:SsfX3, N-terminal domain/GDSL-like Lipase/Acylhydrolase family